MNKKSAFTITEVLIVITVVSIIFGISSFAYQSSQKKSKTRENFYRANEIIQAVERFKGINPSGSRYPTINDLNAPTDFATKDQGIRDFLSKDTQRLISFRSNPDEDTKIRFESCISTATNRPVGVRVYYWDFVENAYRKIVSGKDDESAGVNCVNN